MSDLEDILNDVPEANEVEAVSEAEADQGDSVNAEAEEQEAVESKEETKAEAETEEDEPPASKDEAEEESWTKAAVIDERRKRQELERKLAELQEGKADDVKAPDVFENQEAYTQYLQDQIAQAKSEMSLAMSEKWARKNYENYDELESEFIDMVKDNPVLQKQLAESDDPADFAAQTALKARKLKELEDVDGLKAKLEQEIRAELEAKYKAENDTKAQQKASKRDSLTPSLAASKSTGGVDDSIDDSLEALLG